jgi:hypothetical protein
MRCARLGVRSLLALVAAGVFTGATAHAQPPAIESGAHFVVFTGANRDLAIGDLMADAMSEVGFRDVRVDQESSGQWMIGLQAGGHAGRFVRGFTEVLYNDTGDSAASGRTGVSPFAPRVAITTRSLFLEWTGGVHIQVPAGTWRVLPYFGGGAGLLRSRIDFTFPDEDRRGFTNDFLYHLDVGVRVFATRHIGFSSELRSVQIPDVGFYRILVGAVFRVD